MHKIQALLETSVYADKEVIKNKSTGKVEVFYRIFSKQTKSYIKMVKKMDYHKKELSITTLHILDEKDPNLPLSLRLSLDAIQPQTLRHNPNSDGNHQLDDNAIITKNTQNVKLDALFSHEELSSLTHIEPTEAQKIAGNYHKPKVKIQGMTVSIENLAGSTRSGINENGDKWEVVMQDHYGYINGTKAIDGDHLDIFVNAQVNKEQLQSLPFYVVEQINPKTGIFDEFKLIAGAKNEAIAKEIYLRNYAKGWSGFGGIGLYEDYSRQILTDSINSTTREDAKQHFLALYKKEFGLTPKITKAKDGIYIYLFSGGSIRAEEGHTKKATYSTQRYFIGAKDWEYAVQHDDKDFYDRDYVLNIDDYLYNIDKDSITLDMSPVKSKEQKEKRGIWNVTFNGKNSTTIYKDFDFINDAIKFEQGKADYIDNQGNFKNGFGVLHIVKHIGKNQDGWVSEKEIINIGVAIRNTKPYHKLHKRVYEYYNNFGDRFRIIIGGKTNKERTISFYSNRKAGFGNDSQNYIYNQPLDRKASVHNDSSNSSVSIIIPQTIQNVNQDQIQGERMNLQEQIKAKKSIYKKALLIIELRKQEQANDTLSNSYKDCRVNKLLDKGYQL